jgi:ABC-2 type transport system permease protein
MLAVRMRLLATAVTALGMAAVIVMVGALFPAVGGSIGKLNLPQGVSDLLGGADYGTIAGWMRSEIGAVYGPLVVGGTAIAAAVGSTAGEEEAGILGLILAHPVRRSQVILAKAAAMAAGVALIVLGTFAGLVVGVAVAGGGIGLAHLAALALHLACFGWAIGALALALAAATGRRAVATGGAAAFAVAGFLINGFAPLVHGIAWLRFVSPFHYSAGHDPLGRGIDAGDLAVLAAASLLLTAIAVVRLERRDLRK